MTKLFSYNTASLFLVLSAAIQVILAAVSGFGPGATLLLPLALLFLLFAWGMKRQMRWLAYFAFIVLLIATLVAFALAFGDATIPAWMYGVMTGMNLVALTSLFGILWRSKAVGA